MYTSTRNVDDVNDAALLEGWALFYSGADSTDDIDSDYRIERDDEADKFTGDDDAWTHVVIKALEGSVLHRDALACLRDEGPVDFARVLTSITAHQRVALADAGLSMDQERIDTCLASQS